MMCVVVLLYSPVVAQEWVRRYNGPADTTDEATAIAVDADGNIYVTGRSLGSGTWF
ncbi:MAG: SBBP repeat-containing protein, partial [candidate division WOR-3 bacterium]